MYDTHFNILSIRKCQIYDTHTNLLDSTGDWHRSRRRSGSGSGKGSRSVHSQNVSVVVEFGVLNVSYFSADRFYCKLVSVEQFKETNIMNSVITNGASFEVVFIKN